MRTLYIFLQVIVLSVCVVPLNAATIHVPADQPTIQAGIDAAVDGDMVIVENGIYAGIGNRDISFDGKAIIVTSADGPDSCIIDCDWEGRGFYFYNGEGRNSILHGFTIRDGWLRDQDGGGVCCIGSSPTIIGNVIKLNYASNGEGGGIYCGYGASALISNNVITNNGARGGAGIMCRDADAIIRGNRITRNICVEWGGGINCHYSTNLIEYNEITDNWAQHSGGIHFAHGSASFVNNTIARNFVLWFDGGGIYIDNSTVDVTNCILWENYPNQILNNSDLVVSYSDVEGGWEGTGNVDEDPLFIDPDGYVYHLLSDSPCIDAGDPESPLDPDSTRADMGAYYYDQGPVSVFVDPDTTIYHRGDLLGFTVTIINRADSTVSFEGWTEVETAWGWFVSPLLGPINITLSPFQTISRHVTQQIPENTPLGGPYIYTALVGTYPEEVLFEDSFELYVIPGLPESGPREQRYEDWGIVESEL